MQVTSLADLKAHLSDFADRVEHQHERFTITRNGRASFVVLSPGDLESLEETIFWLSQPGIRDDLVQAAGAEANGDGLSEADVRASLGLIDPTCG